MVAQRNRLIRYSLPLVFVALLATPSIACASSPDETALDSLALIQMERRVDLADQRDQCYLYAEVLHGLTELAGRQVAASQLDEATATLREMDMVASKLQSASARDAKRLKGVEQLLEHTTHRFQDVVRSVSSDDRAAMQKTLQRLDALHSQVLAKVFAR
jgi:hypothetical protein